MPSGVSMTLPASPRPEELCARKSGEKVNNSILKHGRYFLHILTHSHTHTDIHIDTSKELLETILVLPLP